MASIYLETSFFSACVTDRTDSRSADERMESLTWWSTERPKNDVVTSGEVVAELRVPGYRMSEAALALAYQLVFLELTPEVRGFAAVLVAEKAMPGPESGDAMHVAFAAVHSIEYLLIWNIRHLANVNKTRHLQRICMRHGILPPQIVTPTQFLGDSA